MGLLDKIFSSGGSQSTIVDTVDVSDVAPTAKYKEKYSQMEAEGKRISWWEYQKSIDEGWPYPVATESEMDHIERSTCQVLRGHAPDITSLITHYTKGLCEEANDPEITIFRDEEKAEYWKSLLIDGAANGNRAYQAALIAKNGYGGLMNGWISEEEFEEYERLYKDALKSDAESGNPEAQYAVSEFCIGDAVFQSEIRKRYAEEAMRAGITDAAYLFDGICENEAYSNGETWGFENKIKVYSIVADNTTGSMLGWIQDCVADGYKDGEGDFPKDIAKAIHYYTLAAQNGNSSAKSTLEFIQSRPELFG